MPGRLYKWNPIIVLLAVTMLISACGTLQIDTESELTSGASGNTGTPLTTPIVKPVSDTDDSTLATENEADNAAEAGDATELTDSAVEGAAEEVDSAPAPAETTASPEGQGEAGAETSTPSEIRTIDETWSTYINYEHGFSINFPRTLVHFFGACTWNEEDGDHSYRPELAHVPVAIFEDEETVYISSEYYHELSGETKESDAGGGTRSFFSDCQAVDNSLELLRDPENDFQVKWAIVSAEVGDDAALDAFIKARYGPGCSLNDKTASAQEGVYDVSIAGDGLSLEDTLCPINYATVVKYYPAANKVIAWDTGQAYTFAADVDYTTAYDQEMVDSFRFLTTEGGA
jgi:hypothetical protein